MYFRSITQTHAQHNYMVNRLCTTTQLHQNLGVVFLVIEKCYCKVTVSRKLKFGGILAKGEKVLSKIRSSSEIFTNECAFFSGV
jgi:hypothetical protein